LYSLYEREKKKYLPLNPWADDGFPF
jgi:hypothetical protein